MSMELEQFKWYRYGTSSNDDTITVNAVMGVREGVVLRTRIEAHKGTQSSLCMVFIPNQTIEDFREAIEKEKAKS